MLDGFTRAGAIIGAEIVTDTALPDGWGVYLLVQDRKIMYVGSAQRLRRRMRSYARHQSRGSTSRPVHVALAAAGEVELWVRHWPTPVMIVDALPVHMPLGSEAGIIALYNPPWNRRGRVREAETLNDVVLEVARLMKVSPPADIQVRGYLIMHSGEGDILPEITDEYPKMPVSELRSPMLATDIARSGIAMVDGHYKIEDDDRPDWTELVTRASRVVLLFNGWAKFCWSPGDLH